MISSENALKLRAKFQELRTALAAHPFGQHTQQLKKEFIALLAENNLIPASIPPSRYDTLLNPPWATRLLHHHAGAKQISSPVKSGIAAAVMCDLSGEGTGLMFPFIMLPRPRIVTAWMGLQGDVIVGKFLTIGGFHASGQQFGTALGFWGIGFAVAYPEGNVYGFAGYSLFVTVTADQIESYPPNQAPIIIATNPVDTEQNVPLTLQELSFTINDPEGDLMSYTVTTSPDIGSGNGNMKPSGTYTVPIQGLKDYTQYSWTITVSDTQHTTQQTLTFTTQAVAPVISNPVPEDGAQDVPMDITQLLFTITDYQGDAMEYSVQTQPDIGSDHRINVQNGTFVVPVTGMALDVTYRWFVNVTDGTHWTRKVFSFETGYPSQFDPFEFGWQYQKKITINHTQVASDLQKFPVLVSTVDPDLVKAQDTGGDILFMNNTGVAKRQDHELETFDHATGTLVAWVNTPVLSSSQDTVFYMYYGNPTCKNQQHPAQTWNSHYQAVWHLNNNPTGTIVDSTANNNDGMSNGGMTISDLIDGKTGKCLHFDGTNDYISAPDSSSLKPTGLTLSAWFLSHQDTFTDGHFLAKQCYDYWGNSAGQTYGFDCTPNTLLIAGYFEKDAYAQAEFIGNYQIVPNTWYSLVLTFDKSTGTGNLYVNGILAGTKNCDPSVLWYNDPWDLTMGACRYGSGASHGINDFYNCNLDEVRVLGAPLSPGWISTEFNNQNNPSSFLNIGPEEPGP